MPLLNGDRIPALQALLEEYYQVTEISAASSYIPGRVDVLLIVNPGQMPPVFGYAVDQYVMRGGKVVFLSILIRKFGMLIWDTRRTRTGRWKTFCGSGDRLPLGKHCRRFDARRKSKDAYGRGRVYPLWFLPGRVTATICIFRTPGSLETTENADLKYEVLASTGRQGGRNCGVGSALYPKISGYFGLSPGQSGTYVGAFGSGAVPFPLSF